MRTLLMMLVVPVICAVMDQAQTHPGGLNREGCHNNRQTGEYHCHRAGGGAAASGLAPAGNRLAPTRLTPARSGGSGVFANCAEARAAGAAPVRRGDPGYGPHLDRDNDGVGCEPYRGRP